MLRLMKSAVLALSLLLVGCSVPTDGEYAESLNSVVRIEHPGAMGSGVVIDDEGLILTNAHVVMQTATHPVTKVSVALRDGTEFEGEVLWTSLMHFDLALVKIDPGEYDLTAAKFRTHPIQIGEMVYAVGHPLGQDWSVVFGRVSAYRPVEESSNFYTIQVDMTLLPGNSGGALFDRYGRLVGLPRAVALVRAGMGYSMTGQGFAVSINTVCTMIRC